jgi:RNA polymerase sporulation-specific sigma factor
MRTLINAGKILSKEELNKLFEDLQTTTNPAVRKELENKIFLSTYRLVTYIAKRYNTTCRKFIDIVDLQSVGSFGLLRAIRTFTLEKKVSFPTYASTCIENEIRLELRKLNKSNNEVYLSNPIKSKTNDNEKDNTLEDVLASDINVMETAVTEDLVRYVKALLGESLTPKQKDVLERYFGIGYKNPSTQQEIANRNGESRANISKTLSTAVNTLKNDIAKREENDDLSK